MQRNIRDAGTLGAGGVEFVPFYAYGSEVPGADWATYDFGTPAYLKIFKAALRAHKEAGLALDFSLGPNQGQGVPADVLLRDSLYGQAPHSVVISATGVSMESFQVEFDAAGMDDQSVINSTIHLELPSSGGESYRLFAFYQYLTHAQNVVVDSNFTGTIFDDNGYYTVDHFSARGAQVVTKIWDDYLLSDAEIKELLPEVGNYGWEDSIEARSNISWTTALPRIFKDKYGYNLERHLPLIMFGNNNLGVQTASPGSTQCLLDTSDQGKRYLNDYRGALMEGYRAYMEHYMRWTNAMNLQYSSQVAYNLPIDVLANVPYPAVLTGKKVISDELGAIVSEAYSHTVSRLLWQVSRAAAGGVNQVVLHGQSYSEYLFILSDVVKSSGKVSVATTKQPYLLNPWTGEESSVLAYQQKSGRTVIPFAFAANQTMILAFRDTDSFASSIKTTDVPTSIIDHEYSKSGGLHLHVTASSSAKMAFTLSNSKTIIQLINHTVAPGITLSNWTLTVEHWDHPLNISDASIIALKHNTTHRLSSFVSWREIPAIPNVSGIGYYSNTLIWSPSKSASGAYLLLPTAINGARVYMNGHRVPPFVYQAPKINISPHLRSGANEITVEVPSVMWNYLRSIFDELWTGGIHASNVFGSSWGPPGTVDNGLIREAVTVPYVDVYVGRSSRPPSQAPQMKRH
ncbi:uncharacterized protein BO97DRAFT_422416 [Aspergillus homomorphus CBS 101889]|uniref:Uncharacterized protein n=1 Tax=Aspergillus homomorphus (strain CBS 101889) TaxID=1450537 RepID=A0A395I452_ASPHC|nr:hypothetical protein BO97DRAFT_422416 [Aspergillus homomorphus CBS 101889]RAL14516.1 hypothetical protein BO97DRAFT_422416 [Aspergillus homomorphus CBS 101889]